MEKDFYKIADRNNNLGTETAFTVLAKANKLASEGKDIINLGIGQPDFPTPEHIVEAGIKALKMDITATLNQQEYQNSGKPYQMTFL